MNTSFKKLELCSLALLFGAGVLTLTGCNKACHECDACSDTHPRATAYADQPETAPVASDQATVTPSNEGVVENSDGTVSRRNADVAEAPAENISQTTAPLEFLSGSWKAEMHKAATASDAHLPDSAHGTFTFIPTADGGLSGQLDMRDDNDYVYQKHLDISPDLTEQAATGKDNTQPLNTSANNNNFIVSTTDSKRTSTVDKTANFDGTNLTIMGEEERDGKTIKTRATYTRINDDRVDFTMEKNNGDIDDTFNKEFEGTLTRTSSGTGDLKNRI